MSIEDDGFVFSTSIADEMEKAVVEIVALNETVKSIKGLKPECDKIDYILAASSGKLCGIIDIFLVGKAWEFPVGDLTDKWFPNKMVNFCVVRKRSQYPY